MEYALIQDAGRACRGVTPTRDRPRPPSTAALSSSPAGVAPPDSIAKMRGADEPDERLDDLLQRGLRFAVSLTGDGDSGRDLLHDACLRILPRPHGWNPPYLFQVLRNLAIDRSRRDAPVQFLSPSDMPERVERRTPEALLDAGWDDDLERALRQLSLDQREVLHLTVVEELTAREVAEITGRPRGTVLSLVHRAKEKLRELLTHQERDEVEES